MSLATGTASITVTVPLIHTVIPLGLIRRVVTALISVRSLRQPKVIPRTLTRLRLSILLTEIGSGMTWFSTTVSLVSVIPHGRSLARRLPPPRLETDGKVPLEPSRIEALSISLPSPPCS